MQANKIIKKNRLGLTYSLAFISLFFVIASFYAKKNEVSHSKCESQAAVNSTDGIHQFFPGLWQITH